uniref:GPI ethanolamine phosphate transferase 2 C-terminal domain-containing protein n=1 Tax=Oryza glumipatula TaxID=40148 RepID=A0A0D9YZ96_9ORYZ
MAGGGGASPSCAAVAGWTVTAVLLQVVGLSMFLYGFFPVKPTLPGFSGAESYRMPSCGLAGGGEQPALPPDQLRSLYRELSEVPPVYDRLVLMVIDGLPAEFVLGRVGKPPSKEMVESMPYTQSLLAGCKATGYHAKAAPPTVTMPRLKAMVSGAIGGFLDVAFNFNTQAFLDDNLLDQLHMIGYKLVMLGDETWIKLFPKLFWRQDGVSSFYVKDTVEVDFNVSRHLESEFAAKDWNMLILHYLGLDHVGHIGGRQSVLMPQKLKEMDDVIRRVHNAVSGLEDNLDRTLLSSYCSPYDQNEALQVDLAPTLSLLFGTPIPKNNIGVVLPEVFNSLTDQQKLRTLELNSLQFLRLLQAQLPAFCFEDCINAKYGLGIDKIPQSVEKKLCHLLSKAFDSHHPSHLHQTSNVKSIEAGCNRTAVNAYYEFLRYANYHWHLDEVFIIMGIFLYVSSLGSSSFVEEEQYTWHYLTSTLYLIFLIKTTQSMLRESNSTVARAEGKIFHGNDCSYFTSCKLIPSMRDGYKLCTIIIILVSGRILRAWHQGGVNWVHFPDISKSLAQADSFVVKALQIISVLAVVIVAMQLLGLSGHFGLGNTNNLASIDVAGAFIGISSYSTVLSGILMFMITYGSPLLLYLGMVVYISVISSDDISTPHQSKWSCILDKMITLPCLLPLLINSIALTSYTIVLLLMRNHLFVWSVFSPKYLYVCAATVCTCAGVFIIAVTAVYTCTVFSFRMRNYKDKSV